MGILLDTATRVLAVAATGAYGAAQVRFMRRAGTNIVGAVALGRGGTTDDGLPGFDAVSDAVAATGANTAVIYAPPQGVRASVIECADAGLSLAVAFAENVPVHDALYAAAYARDHGMRLIGANTVGLASPGVGLLGSIATAFTAPGPVGVVGRSGTLLLTTARMMTQAGIGQSTLVHAGGDSVVGMNPHELVELLLADAATSAIAYLGEIGGSKEYRLAETIAPASKPVFALIVGQHAPAQKRMGHAGAMIESRRETAAAKRSALAEAGATVCASPMELVARLNQHVSDGKRALSHALAN